MADSTAQGGENQRTTVVKSEQGSLDTLALFTSGDTIGGHVHLSPQPGKRVDHLGVKIEVLGQIELYFDRGNAYDFVSLVREVSPPGELHGPMSIPFEFTRVEMPYESYHGINVRLRYMLRVTMQRSYGNTVTQEFKFWVRNTGIPPEINNSIKMEVGIEDCLHIEFEYAKAKYHLKDVVVGKIFFLLVRIKIKHMEVEIRRRESTGSGPNTYNESETIAKYEVMDGKEGRCIFILFLSPPQTTILFAYLYSQKEPATRAGTRLNRHCMNSYNLYDNKCVVHVFERRDALLLRP